MTARFHDGQARKPRSFAQVNWPAPSCSYGPMVQVEHLCEALSICPHGTAPHLEYWVILNNYIWWYGQSRYCLVVYIPIYSIDVGTRGAGGL